MATLARAYPGVVVPPLIKRNTILFALSQSFSGAGMQFAFGLGPLMVIKLTGSAAMAGLTVGLIGLSRFLVSYPIGKITDTYGLSTTPVRGWRAATHGFTQWIYVTIGLRDRVAPALAFARIRQSLGPVVTFEDARQG